MDFGSLALGYLIGKSEPKSDCECDSEGGGGAFDPLVAFGAFVLIPLFVYFSAELSAFFSGLLGLENYVAHAVAEMRSEGIPAHMAALKESVIRFNFQAGVGVLVPMVLSLFFLLPLKVYLKARSRES